MNLSKKAMNSSNIVNLVSLTKNLAETIRKVCDLADSNQNADQELINFTDELKKSFSSLQDRINYLSLQISQIEDITRMLPLWIKRVNQLQNKIVIPSYDDRFILDSCSNLYSDFELFLYQSTSDCFGSIFYEKSFDQLFGVNARIAKIREILMILKDAIRAVFSKNHRNYKNWQSYLDVVMLHLNNLNMMGNELNCYCINLREKLINELEEVATIKTDF